MEHMDQNLYQLIKSRHQRRFNLNTVQSILYVLKESSCPFSDVDRYQVLLALDHCHAHDYFHRDIKPENILVTSRIANHERYVPFTEQQDILTTQPSALDEYIVKVGDFGLAREISSEPPYTAYVSTRWYRAPEVLLRAHQYSTPVDMWAFGAMAVELATLSPLFPGKDEVDQLFCIVKILGYPAETEQLTSAGLCDNTWKEITSLSNELGLTFPHVRHYLDVKIMPLMH